MVAGGGSLNPECQTVPALSVSLDTVTLARAYRHVSRSESGRPA